MLQRPRHDPRAMANDRDSQRGTGFGLIVSHYRWVVAWILRKVSLAPEVLRRMRFLERRALRELNALFSIVSGHSSSELAASERSFGSAWRTRRGAPRACDGSHTCDGRVSTASILNSARVLIIVSGSSIVNECRQVTFDT